MAAPRLPFLWPLLFKTEASAVRPVRTATRVRALHSRGSRKQQETIAQRYGSANEPPPHLGGGKGLGPPTKQSASSEQTKLPKIGEKLQHDGEVEVKADKQETANTEHNAKTEPTTVEGSTLPVFSSDPMLDAAESLPSREPPGSPRQLAEKPLETVLDSVPDPAEQQRLQQEAQQTAPEYLHPGASFDEHAPPLKAPHIDTPRHVHHLSLIHI